MEGTNTKDDVMPPRKGGSIVRIVLGILFLLPSLCCCASQLLVPTLSTFWMSFQKINIFGSKSEFVGLDNYIRLLGDKGFQAAAGFTFLLIVVRLIVVAIVPLLLAWVVSRSARPFRLGLRIFLTLPVAFFAPVAIAIAWGFFLNPSMGIVTTAPLGKPDSAVAVLVAIDVLYLLGLTAGLGLVAYLPIWRRPVGDSAPTSREVIKPILVIWGIGALGTIIYSLSTFTLSFALTAGGPAGRTTTLALLLYRHAFVMSQFGSAASIATLILLATLIVGMVAGLLVVLTKLRLNVASDPPRLNEAVKKIEPPRRSATILLVILLILMTGLCIVSALPFGWLAQYSFAENGIARFIERSFGIQNFANSLLPPLLTATSQVLITYLAALSLGALQPLGKRSEWLLLLFSPWLFITVLPLSLDKFILIREAGLVNNLLGLVSPILFSVPALFVLTIFFKGRTSQLESETAGISPQDFFKRIILPSLPLAMVLWLLLLFINGQDVFWPLLITQSPDALPLNVALLQLQGMIGRPAIGELASAVTFLALPVCFIVFIILALFQVLYLDRLMIYAGDTPPASQEDIKD